MDHLFFLRDTRILKHATGSAMHFRVSGFVLTNKWTDPHRRLCLAIVVAMGTTEPLIASIDGDAGKGSVWYSNGAYVFSIFRIEMRILRNNTLMRSWLQDGPKTEEDVGAFVERCVADSPVWVMHPTCSGHGHEQMIG